MKIYKLFFLAFFFSILWDLYHPLYGKVFDIIGYILFFIALLFKILYKKKIKLNQYDLFWYIPIVFISVFSIPFYPLMSISILIGATISILIPIYFTDDILKNGNKYIKYFFYFLFLTQLIQTFFFFFLNYNIDFGGLIGFNNSRNEGGGFFRASGILAEGNAIVVTQSLLFILLNQIDNKNNKNFIIYLISITISFSLLGIALAILIFIIKQFSNLKKLKIYNILLLLSIIFIMFIFFSFLDYFNFVYEIFKYRLDPDSNDVSLYLRLFRSIDIPLYELLFPHIYNIENDALPGNAYFTGLYFWGIIYIYFLFRIFYYLKDNLITVLIFFSILLSYQMFSSLLFWLFMSVLFVYKKQNKNLIYDFKKV
jgi:hypothetical protein